MHAHNIYGNHNEESKTLKYHGIEAYDEVSNTLLRNVSKGTSI